MAYDIKRHEVDRLLNVLVPLGWVLKGETYGAKDVTLIVYRRIPDELLAVAGQIESVLKSK